SSSCALHVSAWDMPGTQPCPAPPTHEGTERKHRPTPHVAGGSASSTSPLQSSSSPLHASADAEPGAHDCAMPPAHEATARRHAPAPHVACRRPSSTSPLQSSSTPLHVSGCGLVATQLPNVPVPPTTHACVPAHVLTRHDCETPSSTVPSQSLSRPSHASAEAEAGTHGVYAPPGTP